MSSPSTVRRALIVLSVLFCYSVLQADTKGKLTGKVVDTVNEPVLGANVVIVGTTVGGSADFEGNYTILNIPVGVYDVRVSAMGYQTRLTKELRISAGETTTLNVTIAEAMIEVGEVTAIAERPLVDIRQTSSVAILNKGDISKLPVQSLNDVVNLQAGVVDGHFRGGRTGEVQYQVDGVSVNNPYDNTSVIQLDKSVLEEVQVISGTFDAEYGQAMSGVVNAVLRSGSDERFEGSAEAYGGNYVTNSSGENSFPNVRTSLPPSVQSYTLSLSGPIGLPSTSFMLNVRRFTDDGYLYGERRFRPTDTSDVAAGSEGLRPTGDNEPIPMSRNEEWSGQFKIANRSLKDIQISYQAIASFSKSHKYDFAWRFAPDGTKAQEHTSVVHGFDWTQTLSQTTFYGLSVRQNFFNYTDYAFESLNDPRYYSAGAPRSNPNYELGANVQGYDLGRFKQQTNSFLVKGSLTSQVTPLHLVKLGLEAQISIIEFGAPGTLTSRILDGKHSEVSVVPDSLAHNVKTYYPRSLAVFAQDRVEFKDFLLRAGVRMEYFDANSTIPSDLENPANSIRGVPQSYPKRTSKKIVAAPRLGISYPITANGAVYFSYGHFYQMPGLSNLYSNSDYTVLRDLQVAVPNYDVLGNPDIKPEFTTQYEFGFKQQFGEFLGVDLSAFYKDIRDLLGVEFIDTYTTARYSRFTNVDFGSVFGVKLTIDQRLSSAISLSLNYTYQNAIGNSSDPRETANRASAGEDPRPRQIPFDWDQRHTLNVAATANVPGEYSVTAILKYGSGSPYTPSIGSGFGANLERNSSQKPAWTTVDVRAEKYASLGGLKVNAFARVFNLLDSRYANGSVFGTTGSPFYSITPADYRTLLDPSRFAAPRRVELGIGILL